MTRDLRLTVNRFGLFSADVTPYLSSVIWAMDTRAKERNRSSQDTQLERVSFSKSNESSLITKSSKNEFLVPHPFHKERGKDGVLNLSVFGWILNEPSPKRFCAAIYLMMSIAAALKASWEKTCVQERNSRMAPGPTLFSGTTMVSPG